ncbi:hypothetical protein AAC387_Pa06g0900 [Persea americana]
MGNTVIAAVDGEAPAGEGTFVAKFRSVPGEVAAGEGGASDGGGATITRLRSAAPLPRSSTIGDIADRHSASSRHVIAPFMS